jgi:type III restriction enzyme
LPFSLKTYQKDTLGELRAYLDDARVYGAKDAFIRARNEDVRPGFRAAYHEIDGLQEVPYVCLRVPTGGGKTLLAAYSIPIAGETYLDQEFPATLWFVPTKIIQQQTVDAMKDENHPYRVALDDAFGGRVRVFDSSEITQIRPSDLVDSACVIVSTLAAVRIEDTESRHFYAHNEAFEPFFRSIPANTLGLERDESGRIKFSFANLLHLKRPVVVVDEAHNARTALSFASLARVNPACIIEFTATPDRDPRTGSNVLHSVSAKELRDEAMIKMPIVLTEHRTWEDAVHGAIVEREALAAVARDGNDAVRPIVLLQAQNRDRDVNVDRLLAHLLENEGIDRDRIAVATGDQRELDGIDLFAPDCRIDFIVTVAALREGWDCSYAYVLCSVADLRSATAVEQLLGRVLRMPFATRRTEPALNKAYAHVVSQSFIEAAQSLQDRLVEKMGFDADDFLDTIEPGAPDLFDGARFDATRTKRPFVIELPAPPDLVLTGGPQDGGVTYEPTTEGKYLVTVRGPLSDDVKAGILAVVPRSERTKVEGAFTIYETMFERERTPSEKGVTVTLPRLAVPIQGILEFAEPQLFLDHAHWNLLDYPAEIPNFHYDANTQTWVYDFYKDGEGNETLKYKLADNQGQDLLLPGIAVGWNEIDLVRWLDRKVRDSSVSQPQMLEWLRRLLKHLMTEGRYSIETLVKAKFILAPAIMKRLHTFKQDAEKRGYQDSFFGPNAAPQTTFDYSFTFDPNGYAPHWVYDGRHAFSRHYYPVIGELKSSGEEFACATVIDSMGSIEFWIRNLEKRDNAFWLPLAGRRFFPDFVCKLKDGRMLVVEYKGEVYKTNDDSLEKRQIGKVWADGSRGRCLFIMAVKDDDGRNVDKQLRDLIND